MNDSPLNDSPLNDGHNHGEPSDQRDAVAGFFAAARSQVRDQPATDLDWQRIVHESRRSSRRRNRLALLSSAAVAIIAIFAVFLWQQNGMGDGVRRGEAIVGGNPVTTGEPTSSPSSVSSAQRPTTVPDSFRTWSVSNAGQSTVYALGAQDCEGDDACPVLLRSGTNGRTWTAVHRFDGTDVSAATGTDVPQVQPERAVTQTRFATPQTGYVFGGDLWVTRDGGASFTKMSHPGSTVLDVEINSQHAVLLSSDNCGQGVCNGPVYVTRFDPAKGTITGPDAQVTPRAQVSAGTVTVQNDQVIVQLTAANAGASIAPMRLDDKKLTTLNAPPACSGAALQSVTPATNSKQLQLFALCNPQKAGNSQTSYTIVRSDDAGKSWSSVSRGALILARLGDVWLAAADSKHLVASAGGPRESTGVPAPNGDDSLMVSNNGGNGFGAATPPKGQQLPGTGFDWTASAGGGIVYAVPRTTHGFWMTSDYGTKWTVVDPRH
ncbi:hypothetical protein GCM10011492_08630 [Flexivirga endophytica]|uniref:Uncharacterized protein n=1 Tax=Flexivirga endophytica TaxID=1849103 RepID=A0A916SXG3_9MICO|nr:hypothetical protein [Flexivirga endophytica]GGB20968.1 hypothetical protein GCM10011492_08630 [Flexivirga endophytica]GHB58750.1 hypothetical protein GCM10008112_29650 [Flexivirga endophytica]